MQRGSQQVWQAQASATHSTTPHARLTREVWNMATQGNATGVAAGTPQVGAGTNGGNALPNGGNALPPAGRGAPIGGAGMVGHVSQTPALQGNWGARQQPMAGYAGFGGGLQQQGGNTTQLNGAMGCGAFAGMQYGGQMGTQQLGAQQMIWQLQQQLQQQQSLMGHMQGQLQG